MRLQTQCASVVTAIWFVFAGGCSGEKVPGLGQVSGTVTIDGNPVADASVAFDAAKPGESPSIGKTDASGNYELYYSRGHKGATIGEHAVYITTYQPPTDENPQPKKEMIPVKYNGKSELKATVNRGRNTINFELKSGGEIVQPDEDDQKKKKGKKGKSTAVCA